MEHRLIQGDGSEIYLPFARSRIRALKALGLPYADQSFEIDGVSIKVRIEPGHEYIRIEGGDTNYSVSSEGAGSPDYSLIGLTTKADSVGCRRKKFKDDPPHPTDWVGSTGVTLSYFNGCSTRYRLDYPYYKTPAYTALRIGTIVINTGGRTVLGAGVITYTDPDTGNKKSYIVFATDGVSVSGSGPGVSHATAFYFIPVPKRDEPQDPPTLIGQYAPYDQDVEFGRLDFREEVQATEFPDLAKPTFADPWFFSPEGTEAVSAVIEPNFRELRRGFVAHIAFTSTSDTVTMQYAGKTDETYEKSYYPGTRLVSNTAVSSMIATAEHTYHRHYRLWTPRPTGSIPTYLEMGDVYIDHREYVRRSGFNGTTVYETDASYVDLLIGADYAGVDAVPIVVKRNIARVQRIQTTSTGEYHAAEEDSGVPPSSAPPPGEPYVAGTIYAQLMDVVLSVRYPPALFITKTSYFQEDSTALYFGATKVSEDIERIEDSMMGFEYSTRILTTTYVGEPGWVPPPPSSYLGTLVYGIDYRSGLPIPPNSRLVTSETSDLNSSRPVFTRIDGRYGSLLMFRISLETSGHMRTNNGTSVWEVINEGTKVAKVTLVADGLAPRETDCYVGGETYYYHGAYSPSLGNTGFTSAAYLTSNPWFVANGLGSLVHMLAWTPSIGNPNAVLASANADEWVYSVPTNIVASNMDTQGNMPNELLPDAGHISSFAIKKKGAVLENRSPIRAMSKDTPGRYLGYVQLIKGKKVDKP